jgi:Methyltransferase domain
VADLTVQFMKVPSFGRLENAPCGLCGEWRSEAITQQRAFGENFHVVRCTGCGLIRTNPRPTAEWKANFYDPRFNGYAEAHGRDFIHAPSLARVDGYRRLLLKRQTPRGAKLLDVGCATGLFVKEAMERGFDAVGCDYSEQAVAYGKKHYGVHIIRSTAEVIDAPDEAFDVVSILHVIEHLPAPMPVFRVGPGDDVQQGSVCRPSHGKRAAADLPEF